MFLTKTKTFKTLLSLFLLLGAMAFIGCSKSTHKTVEKEPLFFIQVTDPQLGFYPDSIKKEIKNYETAVAKINQLRPTFVVITGDLVHNERDEFQLAEFKRITSMIDKRIKVYLIPGNHDVGNVPTKESLDFYKGHYNDDKFAFSYKGYHFIGINSNLIHAHTVDFEEQQYNWLRSELERGKKYKKTIVFSHHPFFLEDIEEPVAYFNVDIPTRYRYFDLFSSYQVPAVFAGHFHQNRLAKYKDVEMITTSAVGEPLGKDPVGIRLVKIIDGVVQHHYFPLNEVPSNF